MPLKIHQVPDDWKSAKICPIFKKGDKDCASNNKVTGNMMKHLDKNNILYCLQLGFRYGRYCETQLLELTTALHTNLDHRKQTDLIVLDFSKAFDKVSHSKLTLKLDFYGIRGDTKLWI